MVGTAHPTVMALSLGKFYSKKCEELSYKRLKDGDISRWLTAAQFPSRRDKFAFGNPGQPS